MMVRIELRHAVAVMHRILFLPKIYYLCLTKPILSLWGKQRSGFLSDFNNLHSSTELRSCSLSRLAAV